MLKQTLRNNKFADICIINELREAYEITVCDVQYNIIKFKKKVTFGYFIRTFIISLKMLRRINFE